MGDQINNESVKQRDEEIVELGTWTKKKRNELGQLLNNQNSLINNKNVKRMIVHMSVVTNVITMSANGKHDFVPMMWCVFDIRCDVHAC